MRGYNKKEVVNMTISVPYDNSPQELVFKVVGGRPLYLTYLPPQKKVYNKAPVFLVISGGGWLTQSREVILDGYKISCDLLRECGVCVVSADYRVTSLFPDVDAGDEVGDVLDAIAYLCQNADALEIDSQRIVLTGHSAGGHIASLIAYASPDLFPTVYDAPNLRYVGCVPFGAPCILSLSEAWPEEKQREFINLFPNNVYDDYLANRWSPYNYISKQSTPTLFIHGDSDTVVPVSNSLQSFEKGHRLGADFAIICPENGGHLLEPIDDKRPVIPPYDTMQKIIAEWVREKLGIGVH